MAFEAYIMYVNVIWPNYYLYPKSPNLSLERNLRTENRPTLVKSHRQFNVIDALTALQVRLWVMTLIDCQLLAIVDVVKSCQSTDTQTLNAVLTPIEWTRAHLCNIRHRSTTADIQAALSVVWSFTLLARLGVTLDTNTLTLYNLVDTATAYCLHTNYSYTAINCNRSFRN